MFILGLQGSPRKGGNTDILLAAFMEQAQKAGAAVRTIQVARAGIVPCRGCGYCETNGTCVIADDPMSLLIYGLMRRADVIVAASPVFFYGVSAQLKGLIDRSQTLWSRKYVYQLADPLATIRKGVLLSVGASSGRQLFDGIHLTAKYFFDGINAQFDHALTYRGVESKGAIRNQKNWTDDIHAAVEKVVLPRVRHKRILFVSSTGSTLAPMAAAMAQLKYADRIRTEDAAITPASHLDEAMVRAMESKGVDLAFRSPRSLDQVLKTVAPDLVVSMGQAVTKRLNGEIETIHWPFDPVDSPDAAKVDQLYGEIEERMEKLVTDL